MSKYENYIKIKQELENLFSADQRYGLGFYDDDDWNEAYSKLKELIGFDEESSV